ncbi:MAG: hypothetical protein WBQ32_07130 [Ignavibacteriaceae bacterium]
MANLSKRATIYLDPDIHKVLKVKAAETSTSISEIVNRALRHDLLEDDEDLKSFKDRVSEPTVSFEKLLLDLKKDGKI